MANEFIFKGKEYVLLKEGQWGHQGKPVAEGLNQEIERALQGKCQVPNCRHYAPNNFSDAIPWHVCTTCAQIMREIQMCFANTNPDISRIFAKERNKARELLGKILDELLRPHREGEEERKIDFSNLASPGERVDFTTRLPQILIELQEIEPRGVMRKFIIKVKTVLGWGEKKQIK